MNWIANHFGIEILIAAISLIWTLAHIRHFTGQNTGDGRDFDSRTKDIRAMNTYNSYMLAGIMVFLGFSVQAKVAPPEEAVYLLLIALCSAGLSILFLPLKKVAGDSRPVCVLWFKKLILTQLATIGTVAGIFRIVFAKLL